MNETVLTCRGICKSFGEKQILRDVSLDLHRGEVVALLGLSGVGKTTLFNVLAGVSRPDSGQVLLNGEDVTGKPGRISYMMQKDLLFEHLRVLDNAALPLVWRGRKKSEARAEAQSYFELFGLDGTQRQYPAQVSGGMRQRAALLRTYLASDGVALLDEPFSALDTITKGRMHDWYLDVMEKIDLSTVFITHDVNEAVELGDRVCVLKGRPGRITGVVAVDAPKPRPRDFTLTEDFLRVKRQVTEALFS